LALPQLGLLSFKVRLVWDKPLPVLQSLPTLSLLEWRSQNASDSQMIDVKLERLPWWGVLCVILGAIVVAFLFDHFGKFALARPTIYSAAMISIAVAMRWRLRRQAWFWITIAVIVAFHVPLILFVPWTTKWVPVFAIAPIAIADLYAVLAILAMVERLVTTRKASE
jgi:hypothetical protein